MDFLVKDLWEKLGDIAVNDDGETENNFLHFPPGTDREEIWYWFEDTFDIPIFQLMELKEII